MDDIIIYILPKYSNIHQFTVSKALAEMNVYMVDSDMEDFFTTPPPPLSPPYTQSSSSLTTRDRA